MVEDKKVQKFTKISSFQEKIAVKDFVSSIQRETPRFLKIQLEILKKILQY